MTIADATLAVIRQASPTAARSAALLRCLCEPQTVATANASKATIDIAEMCAVVSASPTAARRAAILRYLHEPQTVAGLAATLGVSKSTVDRDLAAMIAVVEIEIVGDLNHKQRRFYRAVFS